MGDVHVAGRSEVATNHIVALDQGGAIHLTLLCCLDKHPSVNGCNFGLKLGSKLRMILVNLGNQSLDCSIVCDFGSAGGHFDFPCNGDDAVALDGGF